MAKGVPDPLLRIARSITNYSPRLEHFILCAYKLYFKYFVSAYIALRAKFLSWQTAGRYYDAEINPFRLLFIPPESVKFKNSNKDVFDYPYYVCEVVDGDWDKNCSLFRDSDVFRAFETRFVHESEWKRTEFYHRVLNQIENGKKMWGCSTAAEFQKRCSKLEELYRQIEKVGYKSQRELEHGSIPVSEVHVYKCTPELGEVCVDIDREGNFILNEGRHRLAIAQVSDTVDEIPVRVKGRHKEWQERRDQYVNGEISEDSDIASHPDISYLRE